MILGRDAGYLFIHAPHTGGTALRAELEELYGGEKILQKHAGPQDARDALGDAEYRRLLKIVVRRNPLDVWTTKYQRLATNHGGRYLLPFDPDREQWVTPELRRQFIRIQREGLTFPQYLAAWPDEHPLPRHYYENVDVVLRFETLQADFAAALHRLGLERRRALPRVNATRRKRAWRDFYDGPAQVIARARKTPLMRFHGYDFPDGWAGARPRSVAGAAFRLRTALSERAPALKRRLLPPGPMPDPKLADAAEALLQAETGG